MAEDQLTKELAALKKYTDRQAQGDPSTRMMPEPIVSAMIRDFVGGVSLGATDPLINQYYQKLFPAMTNPMVEALGGPKDYYEGVQPRDLGIAGGALRVAGGIMTGRGPASLARAGLAKALPGLARGAGMTSVGEVAPMAAGAVPKLSRLFNVGAGALEGAGVAGATEAIQGGDVGDIAQAAAIGGGMAATIGGMVAGGDYLVKGALGKWLRPKNVLDLDEIKARYPGRSIWDPPLHSQDPGLDKAIMDVFDRERIDVIPLAVRRGDPTVEMVTEKVAKSQAGQSLFKETYQTVQGQLVDWGKRSVKLILPGQRVSSVQVGTMMKQSLTDFKQALHDEASKTYDDLLDNQALGKYVGKGGRELALDLRQWLDSEGKGDVPGMQRVYHMIDSLRGRKIVKDVWDVGTSKYEKVEDYTPLTFKQLWGALQDLYPKKKIWDDQDYFAATVWHQAKDFLRNHINAYADEIGNPDLPLAFAKADAKWAALRQLDEHPIAREILNGDPTKLLKKVSETTTSLQAVRQFFGDSGDEAIERIARIKIEDALNQSIIDGRVNRVKLMSMLKTMGGMGDRGRDGPYMDELFKSIPEVRAKWDEFLDAMDYMNRQPGSPLAVYGGNQTIREEQYGAGLTTSAKNSLNFVLSWVAGKYAAKSITNPAATNPMLGGTIPPIAPMGKWMRGSGALVRGAMQVDPVRNLFNEKDTERDAKYSKDRARDEALRRQFGQAQQVPAR